MADQGRISGWDRGGDAPECGQPMAGDVTTELAIVGGGYTGLSTALHAAEAGIKAHVLEAERVGFGGSGRNVGLVNAGVWYPPAKVRGILGEERGARFVQVMGDAPGVVFDLIERHQIRCAATRAGTIHAAHSARGLRDLQGRHAEWTRLGAPVRLLSADEVAERSGSAAFHGGLWDARAGTVDPMGYVRGLARAAVGAGAVVHTGVRAQGLRRDGEVWVVETDRGVVRARQVVLATNAYTDDLWPGLARVFTPIEYFQLASRPLGERAAHILPGGEGLWDTGTIMTSVRRDVEGRLIVGSMGPVLGEAGGGLSQRWAARRLARLFPGLGKVEFESAWAGRIAMTADHLPRILALAPGLWTPVGYNGRGITTGTVFGRAMARLVAGDGPETLPLPVGEMRTERARTVKAMAFRAAFVANQLWRGV